MKRNGWVIKSLLAAMSVLLLVSLSACGSQGAKDTSKAKSSFPEKNIEIIAPASPGGGWDTTARVVAKVLQEEKLVSQPMTIVNKPGGSGTVGWAYLNQHQGDGHFLAMNSTLLHTNPLKGTTDQKLADFTPIAMLTTEWESVVVGKDSPIKSGKELMEKLKAEPTSLTIGIGAGLANDDHISFILAAKKAGVDIKKLKVVVQPSGAELITNLLGKKIDVIATSVSEAEEQQKAGNVRILAVTSGLRLKGLPDVPTWKEQGIDLVFSHWRGIMGPKGMPADQVKYWDDVLGKMVKTNIWKEIVEKNGWDSAYLPSAEYKAFLEKEDAEFAAIMNELGLVKKK